MSIVFGAMVLALLYAPVHVPTYVGTLLGLLFTSIALEIWMIVRRMRQDRLTA